MSVKIKKRSGQWGMSNLFRKYSKTSAFLDGNCPEIFLAKTITKRRPTECWLFHRLVQKYQHLLAYCKDRTQKYTFALLDIRK